MKEQYSELLKRHENEKIKFAENWYEDKNKLLAMGKNEDVIKLDNHYTDMSKQLNAKHDKEKDAFFKSNEQQKFRHPITGQEMTPEKYQEMKDFVKRREEEQRQKQQTREHER